MKKIFYLFFILLTCLIEPLYANETSPKQPTVILNNLTYIPIHELKILEDTLYISGEDLAQLTYGTYSNDEVGSSLSIQNKKITYTSDDYKIQIDGISKSLNHATYLTQDIIYLPIEILDTIQYPYTLSDDHMTLQITPLLPYSTSIDDYASHHQFVTTSRSLQEVLKPLLDESAAQTLIDKCQQEKSYISFMSTANKARCFEEINDLLTSDQYRHSKVHVFLRQIKLNEHTPSLSKFDQLPLSYKLSANGLELKIGDKSYTSGFFWSTYLPYQKDFVTIDLNKSFDAMLMRGIYSSYRDQYDIKDDLETSPIVTIQMGRSDQMRYRVYFDSTQSSTEYQVIIYKMCTGQAINYYVDFIHA